MILGSQAEPTEMEIGQAKRREATWQCKHKRVSNEVKKGKRLLVRRPEIEEAFRSRRSPVDRQRAEVRWTNC